MNMTEEEAKTKWCPFVQIQAFIPPTYARPEFHSNRTGSNCIASKCMSWRLDRGDKGRCGLAGVS